MTRAAILRNYGYRKSRVIERIKRLCVGVKMPLSTLATTFFVLRVIWWMVHRPISTVLLWRAIICQNNLELCHKGISNDLLCNVRLVQKLQILPQPWAKCWSTVEPTFLFLELMSSHSEHLLPSFLFLFLNRKPIPCKLFRNRNRNSKLVTVNTIVSISNYKFKIESTINNS